MDQIIILSIYFTCIVLIITFFLIMRLKYSSSRNENEPLRNHNPLDRMLHNQGINHAEDAVNQIKSARKQLEKERRKQEKAELRQMEETARKAKQEKEDKRIETARKREQLREEEERKEAESLLLKKQKEKEKEEQDFLDFKHTITVDEEGENRNSSLSDLIEYLNNNKVCNLEELSIEFGIKISVLIDRIKSLINDKVIFGLFDDRGRFISISSEEMENIAQFIESNGKVSLAQVVNEANKILKFC